MFARLMGLATISPALLQLQLQLQQASMHVFDVNALPSWQRAHVPGAQHLDPVAFQRSDLPADPTAVLVFYCSNPFCRKAPNAAKRALKMGFVDVRVMSAGISGWVAAGLGIEAGVLPGEPAVPSAALRDR